jgi:predicted RNA-binding Zn ribbon-like protein
MKAFLLRTGAGSTGPAATDPSRVDIIIYNLPMSTVDDGSDAAVQGTGLLETGAGAQAGRFGLAPAPRGLRLVQDLVNTSLAEHHDGARPDLLQDAGSASAWLRQALAAWSAATGHPAPVIQLDELDLPALRDHRELLRESLRAAPDAQTAPSREIAAKVLLAVTPDGTVSYEPLESGWRAVRALTSVETLLAQASGTWPRLKACAYPPCGACFYDSSPNRTRVWHDTKLCGNITNLRASRARKRG